MRERKSSSIIPEDSAITIDGSSSSNKKYALVDGRIVEVLDETWSEWWPVSP
jgi:hypothetical protein